MTASVGSRPRVAAGVREAVRWGVQHGSTRLAVRRGAAAGDLQSLLLHDPATWREPHDFHERVRARGPLVTGLFTRMSASHAVVREVLGSNDFGVGGPPGPNGALSRTLVKWAVRDHLHPVEPPSLLAVDPPDHTRYRRLVSKVFTPRAVEALRGRVQELADELLDDLTARSTSQPEAPVDLVHEYALRLPVAVIAEVLGVPVDRRDELHRFEVGLRGSVDTASPWRQYRASEAALRDFDAWIGEHLDHLRHHPGDDLLSGLVTVTDDAPTDDRTGPRGAGRLDDRELRSTAGLLIAAGFETTVNLLGSATKLLLDHPDQLALARADPRLWPQVVEEVLRLESPVQLTSRAALRDTTVAGHDVPAGARVVLLLGAANRDPAVFADPGRFDVTRANAREHLAFAGGRHFCLGAALARVESEVGLRSLFERFPALALADGARRTSTRVLRGWERLPVRLS